MHVTLRECFHYLNLCILACLPLVTAGHGLCAGLQSFGFERREPKQCSTKYFPAFVPM
jgi:hypothetical protein